MASKRFKKVYVEISNICNLQCDFCPEVERDKKIMGEALFTRIIGQVAPLTEEVCFHLMGEPLTHPKFSRYLDICAEHSLPVMITSNGLLLNPERTDALLKPIVRQVNFSLHSFEANFPGQDIRPYLEKILTFTRQALADRPDLYINYRLWNLADPRSAKEGNARILDWVESAFGIAVERAVDASHLKSKKVTGRLYLHFDTRFEWPSLNAPLQGTQGFCYGLTSHIGIHADGTLVPCCLDKEAGINLGNCANQALDDLLENERAKNIALGFKGRRLVEDLCQRCTFIDRFRPKAALAT